MMMIHCHAGVSAGTSTSMGSSRRASSCSSCSTASGASSTAVPSSSSFRATIRPPLLPVQPSRVEPMLSSSVKSSLLHVEDVRCATLLSELVYRAAESPDEAAFRQAQVKVEEAVGASLGSVRCHKSGGQRFLVGETEDAIYVAFQGTKSAIDWLANLNFFHGHFGWHHQQQQQQHHHQQQHPSSSASSESSFASTSSSSSSGSSGLRRHRSRAHIGFLKRANSAAVSISELHAAAAAAGKRLVLTGHSLGGAVAVLTTVRLLRSLTAAQHAAAAAPAAAGLGLPPLAVDGPEPHVRCISFATPAMANSDLLQEVTAAGWDQYITNIVMPEDPVVPFVNLLLKAPTAPSQQPASSSPSGFFAGLDSPSSSSSSVAPAASVLSRSNSHESQLSLNSTSWGSSLTYEPPASSLLLPPEDLAATLAAAAALQEAAAEGWLEQQQAGGAPVDPAALSRGLGLAIAGDTAAAAAGVSTSFSPLDDIAGSKELASWLAAARGAVNQQAGTQPSQRSFQDGSRCNSNSVASLLSLQSEAFAQWAAGSADGDSSRSSSPTDSPVGGLSPVSMSPISQGSFMRSRHSFGVPVVASWALESSSSLAFSSDGGKASSSSPGSPEPLDSQQHDQQQQQPKVLQAQGSRPPSPLRPQPAAEAAEAQPSATQSANLGSQVARQLKRLQQQLGSARGVGRLAWLTGALAAGARCAAALAAPAAVTGQPFSLLAFLPRAFMGPAALAVIHLVGHAAYQAALPPSHPLGQQWVMTGSGLEPVDKPLASYPRTGEGLGLQELGGLFPGHRMIAYRRRLANLVSQSPAPQTQQQ